MEQFELHGVDMIGLNFRDSRLWAAMVDDLHGAGGENRRCETRVDHQRGSRFCENDRADERLPRPHFSTGDHPIGITT